MIALALVLGPREAAAHGGLWRPDELRVDPGDSNHLLVRSDVWGMIESPDFGKTWHWTCAAAAYGADLSVIRSPLTMLPGGTVVIGSPSSGVVRSRGSLCDFEIVAFFKDQCMGTQCVPYDITAESSASQAVVVLTAGLGTGNAYLNTLWRSPDGGDSWTSLSTALPPDVFATSVRVAPSDPSTLYVGSSDAKVTPTLFLHRSTDGGKTFQQSTIPYTIGANDPQSVVRLYGVHPTHPDLVFIWLDSDVPDPNGKAPDHLFVSSDGGQTITEAFASKNDLPGLTVSPDGNTVFIGGTDDGLWSAKTDDLRSGKPNPFTKVNDGNTWSLAFVEQGLLAGREEFVVEGGTQRMSLGLSKDQGVTFQSVLDICDVRLATCDKGTQAGNLCADLWYGTGNFQYDQQLRRCANDPKPRVDSGTADGGSKAPPKNAVSGPSGGCACRFAAPASDAGVPALASWVLAVSALGERRRARARRRSRRIPRTG